MHGLKPEFWFLVHASLCKGKRTELINFKPSKKLIFFLYYPGCNHSDFLFEAHGVVYKDLRTS
ncbi:hypothetical protein BpHYR1_033263 [Brachionus plicatilis]|uniref:Uncharacterized protein n=1 Tax=Brachionus plicatilis TaxID=10195 RepID=A0A3M7T6T6_BRAPC|nr:hypothetical protein BpHYR1_033263 [Brachionus plicatilis]